MLLLLWMICLGLLFVLLIVVVILFIGIVIFRLEIFLSR